MAMSIGFIMASIAAVVLAKYLPNVPVAHKLILERLDAETALQVGRRVALAAEQGEPA